MGFNEEYLKLRKKRLEDEGNGKTREIITPYRRTLASDVTTTIKTDGGGDIAPVTFGDYAKENKSNNTVTEENKTEERTWFQKSGLWDDGYQFGDVTKTILAGGQDLLENVGAGIANMGEVALDGLVMLGNAMAQGQLNQARNDELMYSGLKKVVTGEEDRSASAIINDYAAYGNEVTKGATDFVKKDLYDAEDVAKFLLTEHNPLSYDNFTGRSSEADSVFGEKVDSLAQSGGQLAATAALQAVGVPWWLTTGATSFGGEAENALNSGATYEEAAISGAISAGAEILTEKISGGISFGGKTLDEGLSSVLASNISNKAVRTLLNLGIDAVGEGGEEILSGVMSAIGQKLTYADEEELFGENGLFSSEEAFESFIGGAVLGGISSGGKAVVDSVKGVDSVTGLKTDTEQKVFDKVYKDALAEAEADGKKLTLKDKTKLYNNVMNQFEKGYVSTDIIEEVLGGEDYSRYQSEIKRQQELDKELNELRNMKSSDMTDIQQERMAELKALKPNTEMVDALKFEIDEKIRAGVEGTKLAESYNEKARRGQAFEADLTQYEPKQAAIVQKAIDSGILNNTNRTHEFVDMVSKISADKGVLFDFANNAKLKESGFALDGKTINGFVTKDGVTLNIDSSKSLNSVVGHEITHVLEGTEIYTELSKAITEYAKSKGDYQGRYDTLSKLYEGVKGADIDAELTADLVGDYLFTDQGFINSLSVEHRNVFKKIYDEIKYLYKVATAGSKEARELEKVKKVFEQAYKQSGKTEGTKYSISDKNIKDVSTGYTYGESYYTMSYTQDGKVVGTLEYGEYDGAPNVKMVEVDPEYRRKGIATKLLQELQNKYPDVEIDFGMSTPDGTALLDSITYDVTDEAIVADRQRLKDLQTELTDLQGKLDVLFDTENLTEAQNKELHDLGDRWQEVYESIGKLEKELRGKKATKTFVKTDTKFSISDSDGKKLSKEQSEYFKDSKMRDDNGNLKVMYHGSQDAGFHTFDPSMSDDGISLFFVDRNDVAASYSGTSETYEAQTIKTAEDMNKFIESIGAEGYEVAENNGKFTLYYEGDRVADSNTAKGIYKEFCWYEGVGEGDANYKVYLNLTNPLEIDAKGRPWNKIDAEFSQEIYDKYNSLTAEEKAALTDLAEWEDFRLFNSEVQEARGDAVASAYAKMGENCNIYDLFSVAADNFSEESMRENARGYLKTRDYAQRAKEGGYDGVIFKNIHDNGGYSNGSEGASTVAIAFNSEQVKSVANEKPTADKDIRFSLSPETDKAYLDAVNKGDTETAQKIVEDVAKQSGYAIHAYHGTPNTEFTEFDKERVGKGNDQYGAGFYFATDKDAASHYGRRVIDSVLSINNPIRMTANKDVNNLIQADITLTSEQAYEVVKRLPDIYDAEESPLGDYFDSYWEHGAQDWMIRELAEQYRDVGLLDSDLFRYYPNELHEALRDVVGYDGVEVTFENSGEKFYVAWFNNQIKSAEPITYDDNGNVIPLSERFNEGKTDIRYSLTKEGEAPKRYGNYNVFGKDIGLAPTQSAENVQKSVQNTPENVQNIAPEAVAPTVDKAVDETYPEDFAPMEHSSMYEREVRGVQAEMDMLATEASRLYAEGKTDEAQAIIEQMQALNESSKDVREKFYNLKDQEKANTEGYLNSLTDADAPPEMEAPYSMPRGNITLDGKTIKRVTKQVTDHLGLDAEDSAKMAQTIQRYAKGEIPEGELFDEIKKNFEYFEEISDNADELKSARKHMRGTKIFVPDNLKADFNGQRKDGYGQFRKEHLGHFTLVNDAARGLGIDQLYQELNERYPNLFPEDIWNAADQLQQMAYVATAEADVEYRSGQYDDETIRDICNIIESGINKYSQGETLKQLDIDREKFYESAGVKQDIAPTFDTANKAQIPGQQTVFEDAQTTEEAPTKETPTEEPPKIAKVLTEEPKTDNKKRGIWSLIKNNVLDKGMIFEDISLKTGNRELQAKWNSIRHAKVKAQQLIGKGDGNVKLLNSIRETVEKSGKTQEFYDYLYHLHNVDRMSLEGNAQARINELEGKFGPLMPEQVVAIAAKEITDKTTERTANTIREAREYLNALETKNKPVFAEEVTADISRATAAELEKANPEFKQAAQEVYDYMNNLREMLVEEGVISRETADLWAEIYPHYVPIRRAGKDGPAINVALDTNRTGINAPIKRATGGNSDILPLFDTMALRTEQTYRAIAKNRFGVELKNTLGTTIDRGDISLDDAINNLDNDEGLLKKGENGANPTFTVFENGERVEFEITEEMYDALKPTGKGLSYTNKVANTVGNVFRGLLTEYNPVFMVTNPVKDSQDILINSQHAGKTYLNIPVAIKEMATKGHWYKEYIANGGEQNTYFDSDSKTFTEADTGIKKIVGMPLRAISAVNNTIERLPRLAEYIASRKNGASVDVSMLDAARVTTNFAAGGDLTKALNRNGFTFLNASTQGAIQQVRNVREAKANGLKGWLQLAGKTAIAGIPALILNDLLWDDDEEYEELSDYVKQDYYIVAKTEDGKFVRIPKGRAVAVIQNAFEQMENLITGDDEVDMQSFFELAIGNLAPNNPLENNVIAPIMQVANNKTWYGEDLVPSRLQDMPDAEQYDETTDSISKWLGEKLDYSPYKINYLLNQYSGGIGDVALPMLTPESDGSGILAPFADKFTTDSTMKNQNVTDFYDTVDELTKNANSANATDEDILKDKYMNTVRSELSELYQMKRDIQNNIVPEDKRYDDIRDEYEGEAIPDDVKDELVREIQEQINAKAKESLDTYGKVNIDNGYATVGDIHYRWYVPSEDSEDAPHWEKITDKQLEKQNKVTRGLGITPSEYWGNKEEYDFAYDSPGKYAVAKSVGGYSSYKSYSSALYDIKADKDEDGKSINGSRKDKVIDWINELDADYGEKIILFKSEYKADDTYNQDIIDYLNSRDDISYSEMESILKELGFTVDSEGYIYWD